MPAFAFLAAEGFIFASRLKLEKKGLYIFSAFVLLSIPVISLLIGLKPDIEFERYMAMSPPFVDQWWPVGLTAILIINLFLVLKPLLSDKFKFLGGRAYEIFSASVVSFFLFVISASALIDGLRLQNESEYYLDNHWRPAEIADLWQRSKNLWPERKILVGFRTHASAVRFHGRHDELIPYPDFDNQENMLRITQYIGEHRYPLFIDSMRVSLSAYSKNPSVVTEISPYAPAFYKELDQRYKDISEWFLNRYKLKGSVRIYCLKHVNPDVLFTAVKE